MDTVKDIRRKFGEKLKNKEFVGNTIEIIGATFEVTEPTIFGTLNLDWSAREWDWYRSLSLNVNDIPGDIPLIWQTIADSSGNINSNYGNLIWSSENGYQYDNVLKKLKSDKNSRQGTMVFIRPSIHTEWNLNGKKDFICTLAYNFLIRNDKLIGNYILRSNDAVYGYKGDCYFATKVQKMMADDLEIETGKIFWTVSSLHIYDRHYYLVDNYNKTGEMSITKEEYKVNYPDSAYV